MTTTKKLVIAVIALSLALICAIGGTLAFLVAETKPVTNTFTYGEITISLWENVLDENGNVTDEKDYDGIEYGKIVPGDVVNKNPTVTVSNGSEPCYVYVLIENQLGDAANYDIKEDVWEEIGRSENKLLYRYKVDDGIVNAADAEKNLVVFEKLVFSSDLDKNTIGALAGKNVVISAYAHQSDNTTVDIANEAAIKWAKV